MGNQIPRSLRTAKTFNGFPLINCATSGTICLADEDGQPRFLLPPSGQIVQVPQHQLRWMSIDGIMTSEIEYAEPEDLPDDNVVAVITLEAYHDLEIWNANCGSVEQVDLSWMLVLGERYTDPYQLDRSLCQADRSRVRGYYQGLIITPEAKSNLKLLPQSFREDRNRSAIARYMVPEV